MHVSTTDSILIRFTQNILYKLYIHGTLLGLYKRHKFMHVQHCTCRCQPRIFYAAASTIAYINIYIVPIYGRRIIV